MRYYQMDAKALALELNSDHVIGRSETNRASQNKAGINLAQLLNRVLSHLRSKQYIAMIVSAAFYFLTIVFSFLNKNYSLLLISLLAFIGFVFMDFVELLVLSLQEMRHEMNCVESRQKVMVIRSDQKQAIDPDDLMIGDLLLLESGSILHADARVISCNHLFIDEKNVFNTDIASAKTSEPILAENLAAEQQSNMLWKGSVVRSGTCRCMVTALNEDCYIEKTGGRKEKQHHSYYLNRQNSFGNLLTIVLLLVFAVLTFVSALITKRFLDAVFLMAILSSLLNSNIIYYLPKYYLYKTANQLYKGGTLVRNIEAFDGMNREKELYFDCERLISSSLTYSFTEEYIESEASSLNYYQALLGQKASDLKKTYSDTIQLVPGSAVERDQIGNYFGAFMNEGKAKVVVLGYWQGMRKIINNMDDSLLQQIQTLERQGKMVWLLAGKDLPFDSGLALNTMDQLTLRSMLVFDIHVNPIQKKQIERVFHAEMSCVLYSRYSDYLTEFVAKSYGFQKILNECPEKSFYSAMNNTNEILVADYQSSSFDQEHSNVLLKDQNTIIDVIQTVKQLFCGLSRTIHFIGVLSAFVIISIVIMFFADTQIETMVVSLLLLKPLFYLSGQAFIGSTINFSKSGKSVVFASFCGLVGLFSAITHSEIALICVEFSLILIIAYLMVRMLIRYKKCIINPVAILIAAILVLMSAFLHFEFMGTILLLALFPPLATYLLDLFY